jgi:hypothetical protein
MDAPATTVWVAPALPDAEQTRALSSWARTHGVRLMAPVEGSAPSLAVDPRIADDVERLLDRARDAMVARDGEAVDRVLSAAASTLQAHPELPQAAWLMAEVERARSTRLHRIAPVDDSAAAAAWTGAEALDGGRVAGIGEQGAPSPAPATLALPSGLPAGARVRIDGATASPGTVATHAGPHALVVEIDGSPAWASWIEAKAGTSAVQVSAPLAPECSRADVTRATPSGDGVDATGVRCASWIAVLAEPAGVRVAVCAGDHCGPFVVWRAPVPWTYDPPVERSDRHGWPAWATWGLAGVGAAVVTGGVIVASGVLKPAPTETQFVSGGVRTQ